MPPRHWQRAWKRATWLRRLSGLTSEPSTLERGVESWIASLRAIRASRTASPESAAEPTTIASSSTRCCVSSTSAGLIVSSEKTSQGIRTDNSRPSSRHWSEWVTALRQESSARPRSEPATGESDCSSWPTARVERGGYTRDKGNPEQERLTLEGLAQQWATPQARDFENPGSLDRIAAQRAKGHGCRNLNDEAAHWQTPATDSFRSRGSDRKDEMGLDQQARRWPTPVAAPEAPNKNSNTVNGPTSLGEAATVFADTWPTPTARDPKGQDLPSHEGGRSLPMAAGSFSPPAPATDAGQKYSGKRRVLNPLFVEWLMGWPIGWTDSAPVETGLSRWLRLMRGRLSTLCSRPIEPQGRLL